MATVFLLSLSVFAEAGSAGSNAVEVSSKLKVKSDLLAIELSRKLGEKLELPDYMNGGKYLTDEKSGEPFSSGRDGIPGTTDDIRLDQP